MEKEDLIKEYSNDEITIDLKEMDHKGAAIATINSKRVGEMTYFYSGDNVIVIDHAKVDSAFKGRFIGKKLLYKVVEMAREKELKIVPRCSFAAAMFDKISDIQDVVKE